MSGPGRRRASTKALAHGRTFGPSYLAGRNSLSAGQLQTTADGLRPPVGDKPALETVFLSRLERQAGVPGGEHLWLHTRRT